MKKSLFCITICLFAAFLMFTGCGKSSRRSGRGSTTHSAISKFENFRDPEFHDLVFEASTIVKAGKFLQSQAPGEKILFIVPPAYVKTGRAKQIRKITREYGVDFEIAAPEVENPEEYLPEMQFKYANLVLFSTRFSSGPLSAAT